MVQWTEEQREAIYQRGTDILVSAAAGSGKTAVLVERIIQHITREDDPYHIDEILVATFTNAAAEEMRNRIGAALEEQIEKNPTSYHLKKQLSLLPRAHISTLHSFCTTVVREYAYLLDLDPAFRIADEMEIDLIKQEVIDDLFEDCYGREGEALERFFALVDMFSSDRSDVDVEELILTLYTFAMQHPWPEMWLQEVAHIYDVSPKTPESELAWLELLRNDVHHRLLALKKEIERAIEIALSPDGPYHYEEALKSDLVLLDGAIDAIDDWDTLQQHIKAGSLKRLSGKRIECSEEKKDEIKQIRDTFRDEWNEMKKSIFSRSLHGHLEDMHALYPVIVELTSLVLAFKERFSKVKRERAIVDFSDLEHFCLTILLDDKSTEEVLIPSDVATMYQNQFKEILVDEYQDINNVQELILTIVSNSNEHGNMFMVGDVKQSIYRFRHAEPSLFIDKYNRFKEDASSGYRIDLAKNFRSRKAILESTNFIFKQILDESLGDIAYDEAAALQYGNLSYNDVPIENGETELIIINRDSEDEEHNEDAERADELMNAQLEARMYAKKIKEWIGTDSNRPFQVVDKKTNKKRNAQYRDIVILQRSLTGVATIVDELRKQGIPVYAELASGYLEAIEIKVMLNLLKIIDNPHQDIPLASVLRSPIVGLNEEQLTQIRLEERRASFFDALKKYAEAGKEASTLVKTFLEQLEEFRRLAIEGALAELIWEIYRTTGYYDFVGGIPGGRQRQANLRALYDRARHYEQTSFRGLFRFLRFIERMEEQDKDLGEARALSEQEDVVRIMTIHKSKGLEFPLVLLGGLGKQFNFQDLRRKYILDKDEGFATKFIDAEARITYPTLYYLALQQDSLRKMLAEEMRVLYVAMTRAKEKLVMIANVKSMKDVEKKWQSISTHDAWVLPTSVRLEAKSYLDWISPALMRHPNAEQLRGEEATFINHEGMFTEDVAPFEMNIVPATELLKIDEEKKQLQEKVKTAIVEWKDAPFTEESLSKKVDAILSFQYPFQQAVESHAKQSVSEIKRRHEIVDEYSEKMIRKTSSLSLKTRPNFMQQKKELTATERGTAMHTVMQHLPLGKPLNQAEIKQYVDQFVMQEKLTEEEADVIDVLAIEQFFQSPIAKTMFQAEQIEREVPFTYVMRASEVYPDWQGATDEKVLIQGVVDCIVYNEDGIFVVDYKTDTIAEEVTENVKEQLIDRYKVQVKLYEHALANILNVAVKKTYLYFFERSLLLDI